MKKSTKIIAAGAMCALLAATSFAAGSLINIAVDPSIKILVNGEEFKPKDVNGNDVMVFTYNGTTYAPLRALAEAYGLEVGYDSERKMATVGAYYDDGSYNDGGYYEESDWEEEFAPIVYSGSGDSVIDIDPPKDCMWVLYVSGNDNSDYFGVQGYAADNSTTELFVNTTKPYSGVTFDPSFKTTQLEISATGDWYVEIRSIYSCDVIETSDTYYGSGDNVVLMYIGAQTAEINGNDDGAYFGVKSYGDSEDLLVNTTEPYSGTVKLKYDPEVLRITAEGDWNVTLNWN